MLLAWSIMLSPLSITTGVEALLSPAVNAALPPLVVTSALLFMAMVTLDALLVCPRPSLTANCIVRFPVVGVEALL